MHQPFRLALERIPLNAAFITLMKETHFVADEVLRRVLFINASVVNFLSSVTNSVRYLGQAELLTIKKASKDGSDDSDEGDEGQGQGHGQGPRVPRSDKIQQGAKIFLSEKEK